MNAFTRIPLQPEFPAPQGGGSLGRFVASLFTAIGTAVAVAIGAVLAVFAAVAVAVLAVVGAVVVFLTGMVLKSRLRRRTRQGDPAEADPQVLEARKVGHAWVAYGWDQPTR